MKASPAVIVLAAGAGSRFGGPTHKLSQRLGHSSVLGSTLRNALDTRMPVVVVTTELLSDAARRLVAARDVVVLPAADSAAAEPLGMGYSIATGVAARPDASGWLVLPGDMPLVRASTLLAVARSLDQHAVAFAQFRGRRGHPVGFAAELYSELVTLAGDEGARRLVARYPAQGVEVDDDGVLIDVDTEEDLRRVRSMNGGATAAPPP
jgi:molybdenum cofactor cytidylyltransferase